MCCAAQWLAEMVCEVRNSEDEAIGSEASMAAKERERQGKMLRDTKLEREKYQSKMRQEQAREQRRAKAGATKSKHSTGPVMSSSLKTFLSSGPTAVDALDSYR